MRQQIAYMLCTEKKIPARIHYHKQMSTELLKFLFYFFFFVCIVIFFSIQCH